MNLGLVVNARGKICIVHDGTFKQLWVGYHLDRMHIEIILDNGEGYPVEWTADLEMDSYLSRISKILIIRMENKNFR